MPANGEPGMLNRIKKRAAQALNAGSTKDPLTRTVDFTLITLITLNVVAVVLESVPEIHQPFSRFFFAFEVFSVAIFTVEYLMRVWSITENPWSDEYKHPVWGRLRYLVSPMALIDLLAILPFYLAMFLSIDLRFLRVVRLLRVLKLTRYSSAMTMLFDVFRDEARVIGAALFVLLMLLVVTSSTIYLVEHEVQPDDFATIPHAMWWAIITMTTVGYGDVVPVTGIGKLLGALMGIIGIGMVALPAGILASGFNQALHSRRRNLEIEVDRAYDDGVLAPFEMAALEKKRQELNLSEEDLQELLSEFTQYPTRQDQQVSRCPHCGKSLPGEADSS